jgi:hypothetical protein
MSHANRWSIVIAAWLLCSPPAFAAAAFKSGNELLQECAERPALFCFGYIDAVSDAFVRNILNGYEACVHKDVTADQLKDIVVQYLRLNPADRHLGAVGLVADAISKAFPCRQ